MAGGGESELVDYISFHFFYSFFTQAYPDSILDFKLDEGPDVVLHVGASIGLKTEAELVFIDGLICVITIIGVFLLSL